MPAGVDLNKWKQILDSTKHNHENISGTTTSSMFDNVPEDRSRYVTSLILSEDGFSGSQQVNVNKVDEGGNASAILSGFNLPTSANELISVEDQGVFLPSFEGGTRLEVSPQSSSVNATVFWFDNEV